MPGDIHPKVNRVLDAARAWREHMKTVPGAVFRCDEALVVAIDALDAPRERWTVSDGWLRDNSSDWQGQRRLEVGSGELGEKIAAALNAAERKP